MSPIAYARIVNTYADGSSVRMEVGVEANGPDSIDECVRRVKDLWRECIGDDAEAEGRDS